MNKNNKSLGLGTRFQNLTLATVNGYCKFFLLPFALMVVLFLTNISVKAQGEDTPKAMYRQFQAKSEQFDKLFNDDIHDRLILTYHKDVTILDGKDQDVGVRVLFMDKSLGKPEVGPAELTGAKHIYLYENKLFYIIDKVNIYYYDLASKQARLIYQANDRIINFYNMPGNRVLINALNGSPSLTEPVSRLSVYNYETQESVNVTDNPNIYQAFSVGNKVVYLESSFWFATSGITFRANVYDLATGKTYSRSDFNVLGSGNATSDSTFILRFEPAGGGANIWAVVNVNLDLHDATFSMFNMLEGGGLGIVPIAGGEKDPMSSTMYFMNNEIVLDGGCYNKNLKTGFVPKRDVGEIWSMNLSKFSENYVGKFQDAITQRTIYGGYQLDNRFVSAGSDWFLTSKLYGTIGIKNQVLHGVSVYPNPTTKGFITINTPEPASIEVYSVTGQMTFSQKASFENTQVMILPGVNILKVTINGQTQTIKVMGK